MMMKMMMKKKKKKTEGKNPLLCNLNKQDRSF